MGVGSGRFASGLGVEPAVGALLLAARCDVRVAVARGESLPFPHGIIGAVLFVVTLRSINDPLSALCEANTVFRAEVGLVLGLALAEEAWDQHYQGLGAQGHPYYQRAHFFTRPKLTALLARAGFHAVRTRSALPRPPEVEPATADAREGGGPAAGFTAILATSPNTLGRRAASAPAEAADLGPAFATPASTV